MDLSMQPFIDFIGNFIFISQNLSLANCCINYQYRETQNQVQYF